MTKGARYSTFNPTTSDSWTAGKMTRLLAPGLFLGCCCGFCYKRQKPARASSASRSNGANGTSRTKVLESIAELNETPSIKPSMTKSTELALEEIPLTKVNDYGIVKNDEVSAQDVANTEEASLISRKNGAIVNSDCRSKSSSCNTLSGMRRVIGGLPKREKQQPSMDDEKKTSESDSEIGFTSDVFTKCSRRYSQQKAPALNIPELIIS